MDITPSANAPRPSAPPVNDRREELRGIEDKVTRELALLRRCLNMTDPKEEVVDLSGQAPPPVEAPSPPQDEGAVAVSVTMRQESRVEVSVTRTTKESDPLAIDLNGDGRLSTTGVVNGARFDINGDGVTDRSSFITGGDAFLARDANGDGVISSGAELFGDQTGAANGYDNLARHDADGNGWIDANDPVYDSLRLVTAAGEGLQVANTRTLSQAGITAVRVAYASTAGTTDGGDRLAQTSSYRRTDGTEGMTGDLMLRYR